MKPQSIEVMNSVRNLNDYICNIELIGAKIEVVRSNICGIVQLSGIIVNVRFLSKNRKHSIL